MGSFDKLQEVGLLLLWLFSTLRVLWWLSCFRGMSGCILNHGKLPHCGSTHYPDLRADFWVQSEGNLVVSPSRNCSLINELDVRLLNFSIQTYLDQVMVLLLRSCSKGQKTSCIRGQQTSCSRGQQTSCSGGQQTSCSRGQQTSSCRGQQTSSCRGQQTSCSRGQQTSSCRGQQTSSSRGQQTSSYRGQ